MTAIAAVNPAALLRRWGALKLGLVASLALVWALVAWMLIALASADAAPHLARSVSSAEFADLTGFRIVRVTVTGGGGVVDVRYRVEDAVKAGRHAGHTHLNVVDQGSGKALRTPFHFHTNDRHYRAGGTYYELLVNSEGLVEPGDRVSVAADHVRLSDLLVH